MMKYLQRFAVIPVSLLLILGVFIRPTYAESGVTQQLHNLCTDEQNNYSVAAVGWPWEKFIRDGNNGGLGGSTPTAIPDFYTNNSSYVVYRDKIQLALFHAFGAAGNQTVTYDADLASYGFSFPMSESDQFPHNSWDRFTILISTSQDQKINMTSDDALTQWAQVQSGVIRGYTLTNGDDKNHQYATDIGGTSDKWSVNTAVIGCMGTAANVNYNANWSWEHYDAGFGSASDVQCATLDISCQISKVFNGVADTFRAVGQAILKGIGALFMPDANEVKSNFDSFNTFMSQKLGMLVYPISFLSDLFTSFGDTSNNWCNNSSCVKSFGNLFGRNFSINLGQVQTTMPSMWTWFVAMSRGLLILSMIIALRRKYMEVVSR